jgi:hypothetical protein
VQINKTLRVQASSGTLIMPRGILMRQQIRGTCCQESVRKVMPVKAKRALIIGGGVAGPVLARFLKRSGFDVQAWLLGYKLE